VFAAPDPRNKARRRKRRRKKQKDKWLEATRKDDERKQRIMSIYGGNADIMEVAYQNQNQRQRDQRQRDLRHEDKITPHSIYGHVIQKYND
jgi:hypothetical protein